MLDRLENAHKFNSPAAEILARNYKIKIKDILKEGELKANRDKMDKMTSIEWGVNDEKQILVPSFGTTGALFARHFDILRSLRRRIVLLKQAYESQADEERTWQQIEQIIKVLNKGCEFLAFDDILRVTKEEEEEEKN